MSIHEKYDQVLREIREYAEETEEPALVYTGDIRSQALGYLCREKVEKDFTFIVPDLKVDFRRLEEFRENQLVQRGVRVEKIQLNGSSQSSDLLEELVDRVDQDRLLFSSKRNDLSKNGLTDPFAVWDRKHIWALVKREFVEYPEIYESGKIDLNSLDYWKVVEKSLQARKKIEDNVDDHTAFLWTGGKEAQVIADILIDQIGEEKSSDTPFALIDPGNLFEQMYEFRKEYIRDKDVDLMVEKYDEMIENVIENESDPRGYHGRHSGQWICPKCENEAELEDDKIECGICGHREELEDVQKQNMEPEEWGVPESCGALKVIPMKKIIKKGYKKLLTGRKEDDEVVRTESSGNLPLIEERSEPIAHKRINPLAGWETSEVWSYLKLTGTPYCELYDQGFQHTDARCCTSEENQQVGEYGEGGVDTEKQQAKDKLQDMGYV